MEESHKNRVGFLLRLSPSMYKQVKLRSVYRNIPMRTYIVRALMKYMAEENEKRLVWETD